MFLATKRSGYDRGGLFLILMSRKVAPYPALEELRALVRFTAYRQCGQFMMGRATVKGERVGLSGSFGGDGLPINPTDEVWSMGVPVPEELATTYWGEERANEGACYPQLRKWATNPANLRKLRSRP